MKTNQGKQRSVMTHDFSTVPRANINRSTFNRSHGLKTTIDAGPLYPIFLQEVLPGDTHRVRATLFGRLSTPLHPYMDNLMIDQFWFFVPNRLVWDNWQKFMGEQDNPGDSTDFTIPVMNPVTWLEGTLGDYLGLPIPCNQPDLSALPFRCYNKIFNQWFRDENLQNSLVELTNDGPDGTPNYNLVNRGKRHDYFTSCLPWPQKGPGVDLPLGTQAPITGLGFAEADAITSDINVAIKETGVASGIYPNATDISNAAGTDTLWVATDRSGTNSLTQPQIYADLSEATAATINDLRQAFAIQKLQERDARGGTRYQELVLAHFGVRGGDARLQRTEFLGSATHNINVTQVPQTTPLPSGAAAIQTTPQGHLAAYATAQGRGGFTKSFTEHGYLMGLVNIRADLTYQKGIDRHWNRQTKYDYYWPALQSIGEQAVLNKEIYVSSISDPTNDNAVFGYQERFAEYRYAPSKISGAFRSSAAASLDPWHLSEDFQILPVLGDTFITSKPPVDRIVAVPGEPHFLLDCYFDYKATRPMPVKGVPGNIDRF